MIDRLKEKPCDRKMTNSIVEFIVFFFFKEKVLNLMYVFHVYVKNRLKLVTAL